MQSKHRRCLKLASDGVENLVFASLVRSAFNNQSGVLKVMSLRKILIGLFAAITTLSVSAGPDTDALGSCLADNTTGKERKELAKWIFVAMAAHPELKDLSKITDIDREKTYQAIGGMVTKLLTQSCVEQTRSALKTDGREAFKSAFGLLGKLAMQELMNNAEVGASFSGFEHYIDRKKLEALAP